MKVVLIIVNSKRIEEIPVFVLIKIIQSIQKPVVIPSGATVSCTSIGCGDLELHTVIIVLLLPNVIYKVQVLCNSQSVPVFIIPEISCMEIH